MTISDPERPVHHFHVQERRPPDELTEQSFEKSILYYLGSLFGGVGLVLVGVIVLHFKPMRTTFLMCGTVYLLAGIGWPRPLYLALRGMRSFRYIEDPRVMHGVMMAIAAIFLIAGALVRL